MRIPENLSIIEIFKPGRIRRNFIQKVKETFIRLDPNLSEEKKVPDRLGAGQLIATQNSDSTQIEEVGREIGKIK